MIYLISRNAEKFRFPIKPLQVKVLGNVFICSPSQDVSDILILTSIVFGSKPNNEGIAIANVTNPFDLVWLFKYKAEGVGKLGAELIVIEPLAKPCAFPTSFSTVTTQTK